SLTLCRYPHTILFPYTTLFRSKLTMKLTTINKASNSLDNIRNVFINSKIESPITITPCRFINQYYLIYIYQNYLIYLENNKDTRSEEHTSELQSRFDLVCRLLL